MPKTRTKTIALVAGLGAAALVLFLALDWRAIYYAFRPEARFWGRWEVETPPDEAQGAMPLTFTLGFLPDGTMEMHTRFAPVQKSVSLRFVHASGAERSTGLSYRVTRSRVVLSMKGQPAHRPTVETFSTVAPPAQTSAGTDVPAPLLISRTDWTVEARYRFESDDLLLLEMAPPGVTPRNASEMVVTLRRIPDSTPSTPSVPEDLFLVPPGVETRSDR